MTEEVLDEGVKYLEVERVLEVVVVELVLDVVDVVDVGVGVVE